jgi:hypothetical protein
MAYLGNWNPNNDNGRSPDNFQCIKLKLTKFIRHPHNIPKIEDAARRMHQIAKHTLQFLKLIYLFRYEENQRLHMNQRITETIPLTHDLVINIAKVICVPNILGRRPSIATQAMRTMLSQFYNAHYAGAQLHPTEVRPEATHLHTAIDYMGTKILTMIKNNIIKNFEKYIYIFVNCHQNKNAVFENIDNDATLSAEQKKVRKTEFNGRIARIVRDVLSTETEMFNGVARIRYRSGRSRIMLNFLRANALPRRAFIQFDIEQDLNNFPLDYLHGMLVMMSYVDNRGGYKLPNVFPQHTSDIPGYFRLDTSTMIDLLYPLLEDQAFHPAYCAYIHAMTDVDGEGGRSKAEASAGGFMKANEDTLWRAFFKTEKNHITHGLRNLDKPNVPFPYVDDHKFTFHHQLETNGNDVSVILVKKLLAATKNPKNNIYKELEPYIHQIGDATRAILQTKRIVAIDPNLGQDLAHGIMIDKNDYNNAEWYGNEEAMNTAMKEGKRWRHTRNTRRRKMDIKKNRKRLEREKRNTLCINGISIQKRESHLSQYSKKTLSFEAYKQYLYNKNRVSYDTGPFYRRKQMRERRFRAYGKRQKLDTKIINDFKEAYGPPAETAVYWGDWNKNTKNRKFFEPIKGKGLRKIFRKAGYLVFLVNEFKTSKMCSNCQIPGAECTPFRRVKNPRPHMRQRHPTVLCHGLLRCSNCNRLWNRDTNAATNIWIIANAAINNILRPLYLRWPNFANG